MLAKEEEVCNDTMKALWEECKPCLKNTCVKYYSRTCSTGSGLVGRQVGSSHRQKFNGLDIEVGRKGDDVSASFCLQLEDVLNRTNPFSIWINGEKVDFLEQEGQRQKKEFSNLEEKYAEMADGVDSIFSDSMKVKTRVSGGTRNQNEEPAEKRPTDMSSNRLMTLSGNHIQTYSYGNMDTLEVLFTTHCFTFGWFDIHQLL